MMTNVAEAQTEKQRVMDAVTQFVKFADAQNADEVSKLLHEDFRLVLNRLFGSNDVRKMDKSTYLQLIREKKMGGDKRTVEFVKVDVVNQNAAVKVLLKGKELAFESLLQLIQTADGNWQLLNDLPFAVKL